MKSRSFPITMVGLALTVAASGCRLTTPESRPKSEEHARKDIAQTQNQIRLRMRALVGPMCGGIEQAADRIAASTTNRAVQAAAREWKIEAVPAMRSALFQPDPLTALADTWVLCNQMADFFETGPGKSGLSDHGPSAVATCRNLEEGLAQNAASLTLSGDVSKVRAFARQWAADHPIGTSIAGRESILSRAVPRDAAFAASAGEVVVEMATAVDDLSRKLDVYSGQLVRQARWEAEVLGQGVLADGSLDAALSLAERAVRSGEQVTVMATQLAPSIDRAVVVAETAPKLIASEREVAIKALQDELARVIQFVQEERVAALAHLTQERISALKSLDQELQVTRDALAEGLYLNGVKVVDHASWRVAQLAGGILLAAFLAAVLLLLLARRLFRPGRSVDT